VPLTPLTQQTTEVELHDYLTKPPKQDRLLYTGSSDALSVLRQLDVRGRPVVSTIGGCEYPLVFLSGAPSALHLRDISPIACALAEVRLQCLRLLPYVEWQALQWGGSAGAFEHTAAFTRDVLPSLSPVATCIAEATKDWQTFESQGIHVERRAGHAWHPHVLGQDEAAFADLQHTARQTPITIACEYLHPTHEAIDPAAMLYMSNIGIEPEYVLGQCFRYARRYAQAVCSLERNGHVIDRRILRWRDGHLHIDSYATETMEMMHRATATLVGIDDDAEIAAIVSCKTKKSP
jgi:hypothetical protein